MSGRKIAFCLLALAGFGLLFLLVQRRGKQAIKAELVTGPDVARVILQPGPSGARIGLLAGRVSDSEGERVATARVCAVDAPSLASGKPKTACVDVDSDGRYVVTLSAPGAYSVSAEASGFKPGLARAGELISVAFGERKTGLDIVLEHGGTKVAGRVLDITGGAVAGATIQAAQLVSQQSSTFIEARSDVEGKFAVWVVPGDVSLSAIAVGYVPTHLNRVAPSNDVVITLTPGSSVHGNVMSSADRGPVAGVEVRAVPEKGWNSSTHPSGISDADGSFTILGIAPGAHILVAEGDGWRGASDGPLRIGLAESVDHITVVVQRAASVTGFVLSRSDGRPCLLGNVSLGRTGFATLYDPPSVTQSKDRNSGVPVPSMMAAIEAGGAVHFRAVPPGEYHATVQCDDHILSEGPSVIRVGADNVNDLVWKVDPGLGLIVHMVDDADDPLPKATVSLTMSTRSVSTALMGDGEGRAEYPKELYPGTYTLTPSGGDANDRRAVEVELREGTRTAEATVRFPGKGSILVTVVGTDSQPIDDVTVIATALSLPEAAATAPLPQGSNLAPAAGDASSAASAASFRGIALGGGRFRVGPLPPGRYRVRASDGVNPLFEASSPAGGIVEIARGKVSATITVDRGGSISGLVVDQANQPMPDTFLSATCESSNGGDSPTQFPLRAAHRPFGGKQTMSDKEGRFLISGVQASALCTVRAEQPYGLAGEKDGVHPGEDVVVALAAAVKPLGRASIGNGFGQQPARPAPQ